MSKIPFTVRTLKSVTTSKGPALTKESGQGLLLKVARGAGRLHIVLEFPHCYRIKNLIFKNQGAAFLCVYSGSPADWLNLQKTDNPYTLLPSFPTLIPDTQLIAPHQYSHSMLAAQARAPQPAHQSSPLYRIHPFPSSRYSRYIAQRPTKFLVLELRPFWDCAGVHAEDGPFVGVNWVEVYGETCSKEEEEMLESEAVNGVDATQKMLETMLKTSAQAASIASQTLDLGTDSDAWMADVSERQEQTSKRSTAGSLAAAFKPTGRAEAELQRHMAGQSVRAATAAPSTERNVQSPQKPRDSSSSPSASKPSTSAPVCPHHPHSNFLLQRLDRKQTPPRTYYVCTAKDASGKSCDTKIYA